MRRAVKKAYNYYKEVLHIEACSKKACTTKEVLNIMSGTKSKEMDLTVGSPFWSLLKFAIPVILGNLFQLFYTLADSVIVGKTLGANSLAAVGSTSIIIYFVFCFINGFTGGFGICLGQRCGAKDEKGMRKSFLQLC